MRRNERGIMVPIMSLLAAFSISLSGVRGDVLYQQSAGVNQAIAQTFSDFPDLSTYEFDDFVVPAAGWNITKITVIGTEQGDPTFNTAVKLAITTAHDFTT